MADPTMQQLAFDPNAMGGVRSPSFQAPQGAAPVSVTLDPGASGDANWQRILQAYKAGLVSPDQMQKYAQRYASQGAGQQRQQQPQTNDPASNLGQVAGDLVGRAGKAIYNNMSQPQQEPLPQQGARGLPPEAQQWAKPGVNIPADNPPSGQWGY